MSNCYNTHATELFPSTNVLTGIVLQHRGKTFLLPFPHFITINKFAKYEIMISYFFILERFYEMTPLCCRNLRKVVIF